MSRGDSQRDREFCVMMALWADARQVSRLSWCAVHQMVAVKGAAKLYLTRGLGAVAVLIEERSQQAPQFAVTSGLTALR